MNENELISVIIPTRNRMNLLREAVNSVLNQSHTNIEVIIIDEASEDDTGVYLKSIKDKRVKYIQHKIPQGGNIARNRGYKISKGKYIAFLDDDDIWAKNKLEKQLKGMKKDSNIGIVTCNNLVINEKRMIISKSNRGNDVLFPQESAFKSILLENFIGGASFPLIKRECMDKVKGFQENLKSAQETNLYLRIIMEGYDVFTCKEYLLLYREHSQNRITDSYKPKVIGLGQLFDYKKDHCFSDIGDNLKSEIIFEHIYKLSEVYIRHRQNKEFNNVKEQIINNNPLVNKKNYLLKLELLILKNKIVNTKLGNYFKFFVRFYKIRNLNKEWSEKIKVEFY